jgi:hypothetical protein
MSRWTTSRSNSCRELRMALAEIGGEAALIEVGQQGAFAGCLRGEGQIFAIVEREDLK